MDAEKLEKDELQMLQDKLVDFGAQFDDFTPKVVQMSTELACLRAAVRNHWLCDADMVSGTICEVEGVRYGVFPAASEGDEGVPGYYLCRIGASTEILHHFKRSHTDRLLLLAQALAPLHEWSGFNPALP